MISKRLLIQAPIFLVVAIVAAMIKGGGALRLADLLFGALVGGIAASAAGPMLKHQVDTGEEDSRKHTLNLTRLLVGLFLGFIGLVIGVIISAILAQLFMTSIYNITDGEVAASLGKSELWNSTMSIFVITGAILGVTVLEIPWILISRRMKPTATIESS